MHYRYARIYIVSAMLARYKIREALSAQRGSLLAQEIFDTLTKLFQVNHIVPPLGGGDVPPATITDGSYVEITPRRPFRDVRVPATRMPAASRSYTDVAPPNYRPMIPTLVAKPFHRDGWVYEEKVDGYRMLAYKAGAAALGCRRPGR